MKRVALMLMILSLPLPVVASHTWSGIDLCEVYQDKLPPGLTAASLPEPQSPGAGLLHQYCTQCHNLPGPDRHTAAEWHAVASKMFELMDVSNRFGGLMGQVETMAEEEQEMLLAYLQRHAMAPLSLQVSADKGQVGDSWGTQILVLIPFLLLVGLGLLRWWRNLRSDKKHA